MYYQTNSWCYQEWFVWFSLISKKIVASYILINAVQIFEQIQKNILSKVDDDTNVCISNCTLEWSLKQFNLQRLVLLFFIRRIFYWKHKRFVWKIQSSTYNLQCFYSSGVVIVFIRGRSYTGSSQEERKEVSSII